MMESAFRTFLAIAVAAIIVQEPRNGIRFAKAQTINDVNKLSKKLMKDYNRNTLPSNNQSAPFWFTLAVSLMDLGELDDVKEKLSAIVFFSLAWQDDSIRWNPSDHNNVTTITMDQQSVWLPILKVINIHHETNDGPKDMDKVTYGHEGNAFFSQYIVLHTVCELDVTYYPFDNQECEIRTKINDFDSDHTYQIYTMFDDNLLGLFDGDGLWDIVKSQARAGVRNSVTLTFEFKRKPLYILLNVVLPIFVLALLTPAVFLLPSGERLGFAVTTLLAISVYMTIVSSYLPQKSDPLPLMSILLFIWYVMTAFMIFVVICNVKIYAREPSMPLTAPAVCLIKFYRCTGKNGRKVKNNDASSNDESEVVDSSRCEYDKPTWQDVSEAIDMIALVFAYTIDLLITLTFILVLSTHA